MSGNNRGRNDIVRDLVRFIGETVTIFTTSGGESGMGFTGILIGIDPEVVRLIAVIGPAPGCALGSCCDVNRSRRHRDDERSIGRSRRINFGEDEDENENEEDLGENSRLRFECGRVRNTGAIVDIPVNRIAAFVHNAI